MDSEKKGINKGDFLMRVGTLLLILGLVFFAVVVALLFVVVLLHHEGYRPNIDTVNQLNASLVSLGFLSIMLSLTFLFPELLKGGPNEGMSTMRVAVYMIICVFVFLTVKMGWACKSFDEFRISSGWVSIVIAALGGKAVQSLGENALLGKKQQGSLQAAPTPQGPPPVRPNPSSNATAAIAKADVFDAHKISMVPPMTRPPHIK